MAIKRFTQEFEFLSNFYPSLIRVWGYNFPTVEHAYQAAKDPREPHFKRILVSENPKHAKKEGKKARLRYDWEQVKDDIMLEAVRAKFEQNHFLRERLLETANQYLEEGNWWGDTYWGTCNGVGRNQLGKILMHVRDEMRGRYESKEGKATSA